MRHPNVRNADEVEAHEMIKGRHNMRLRQPGKPAGSRALGATLTEVAPGAVSFPRHAHHANEEAIYVLSGSGEARIGEERVAVRASRQCMVSKSSSIPIRKKSARASPIRQARLASGASSAPGAARSTIGRESPRPARNSSG
jgi:mannose-6-phosphate isomerase-like protein (cupin superfamily)